MVHHVIKIYKEHCRTRENSNVLLGSEESRPSMCSIAKFLCLAVTHGSGSQAVPLMLEANHSHRPSPAKNWMTIFIGSYCPPPSSGPQSLAAGDDDIKKHCSLEVLCLFVTLKPRRALSVCGCGKVSFVDNSIWIDQLLPQARKVFGVLLQKSGSGFQCTPGSVSKHLLCLLQLFSLCLVRYQRLIVYDPCFLRWCMKRYTVEKLNLPQRGRTASAKQT